MALRRLCGKGKEKEGEPGQAATGRPRRPAFGFVGANLLDSAGSGAEKSEFSRGAAAARPHQ